MKVRAVKTAPHAWILAHLLLLSTAVACAPVHIQTRNGVYHPVQKGETLWRICAAYRANMTSVCMFNGITDPDSIRAGQRLFIPGARQVIELPPGGTVASGPPEEAAAPPETGGGRPRNGPAFGWPVMGRVTSGFGIRKGRRHDGIDIAAARGTPVLAAEGGTVVYSGNGVRGYGNLIIIQHAGPFSTVYAHNDKNLVGVDAWVRKGQQIATVGDTGRSRGDHLHFEIRKRVKPVDPLAYLPNLQ